MAGSSTTFFFEAVKSLLEKDVEIINRYIIPKIVALNFGIVDRYPELKFGQVGFTDTAALAEALSKLVSSNLLTGTYETESHVRELLHLPDISEEQYEKEKNAIEINPDDVTKKEISKVDKDEATKAIPAEEQQTAAVLKKEEPTKASDPVHQHTVCHCDDCKEFTLDYTFDHESIVKHQIE